MPSISSLECSRCHHAVSAGALPTACPLCDSPLLIRYDMDELKRTARREALSSQAGKWRYSSVLPDISPLSLGEGWTPIWQSRQHPALFIKDEGANPSGSFAARGIALAVAAAKHNRVQRISIAEDGEAGAALAVYAAAAGIKAHVILPQDVEIASHLQCIAFGAEVSFAKKLKDEGWFDISTGREPYRLEGLKTMGYELVEQMGWEYPAALFCPGGMAAPAIWKAFEEMEQLGWVAGRRPRMYVISELNHFDRDVIAESGGRSVDGGDWRDRLPAWGKKEGILLSPEGAMAAAAYEALLAGGELEADDRAVLFNPAAGLKYADVAARGLRLRSSLPSSLPVGGIITPQ